MFLIFQQVTFYNFMNLHHHKPLKFPQDIFQATMEIEICLYLLRLEFVANKIVQKNRI